MGPRSDGTGFARVLQSESGQVERGMAAVHQAGADKGPRPQEPASLEPTLAMQGDGETEAAAIPLLLLSAGMERAEVRTNGAGIDEGKLRPGHPPPPGAGGLRAGQPDAASIMADLRRSPGPMHLQLSSAEIESASPDLNDILTLLQDTAVSFASVDAPGPEQYPTPESGQAAPDGLGTVDAMVPLMRAGDDPSGVAFSRTVPEAPSPARQILNLLLAGLDTRGTAAPVRVLKALLKPEHLGEVEIIMRSDAAGGIRIRIEAQLEETADRLSQDRRQIGSMLQALGIALTDGGITITARSGSDSPPTESWLQRDGAQDSLTHSHGHSPRGGGEPRADSQRRAGAARPMTEVNADEVDGPSPLSHARRGTGRFV
jgi:hypothetical protein